MMRSSLVLSLVGCLFAANSVLADDSHNDHDRDHNRDRDDVRFECVFRGVHLRKVPIFCEAHGRFDSKIPHDHFITGDRDDHLTVTCDDHISRLPRQGRARNTSKADAQSLRPNPFQNH